MSNLRISYLNPKCNCYEYCWCRNITDEDKYISKEIY